MRADQKLVALGLAESRSRAQALIKAGAVRCDGAVLRRASKAIDKDARLELDQDQAAAALPYVSRGGVKLAHALDLFELSPKGAIAIDLGASTGGFTEVLLLRGATRVYAVDVGVGQLAATLADDARVVEVSGVNARSLDAAQIPDRPSFLVADLSFISVLKALPAPLALLAPTATLVLLVKPQFEVGRAAIGKGGVVKDAAAQEAALERVRTWLRAAGWGILGVADSPILGGDGNREFLSSGRARRAGGRMSAPADLTSLFTPVAPPCPHAGACGGCAFQNIRLEDLAAWKRDRVAGALKAQGLSAEVLDTQVSPPRSRRRARLSGMRTKKSVLLGFRQAGAHTLTPIEECLLLRPEILAARPHLEALVRIAAPRSRPIGLWATALDGGLDIAIEGAKPLEMDADGLAMREQAAECAETADVARLTWNGEIVAARRPARLKVGQAMVEPPPAAFLQATEEGERALAAVALEGAKGRRRVADLFAGVGAFALRLAETAEVLAVEGDAAMTAALDSAARRTPGLRRVVTVSRDLFRCPLRAEELAGVEAVVLDPPRAGAEAQMREISRVFPKFAADRVISLSCDSATFARDSRILVDGGWRLGPVWPIDQFLWSPHTEIAAILER